MSRRYIDNNGEEHIVAGRVAPDIASTEKQGIVSISTQNDVTENVGQVLSASEKNKNVEGSIASDINNINAKLGDLPARDSSGNIIGTNGTVAGAISSLNNTLETTNQEVSKYKIVKYSPSSDITVAKQSMTYADITNVVPSGYVPISAFINTVAKPDSTYFVFGLLNWNSTYRLNIYNPQSSDGKIYTSNVITILCVKNT